MLCYDSLDSRIGVVMNIEQNIKNSIALKVSSLGQEINLNDIVLERPKYEGQGDLSTNIAMKLAKVFHKAPVVLAKDIISDLNIEGVDKIEIAGPGFINFFISKNQITSLIKTIIEQGKNYGSTTLGKNEKVLLEYVSANPTGALHLGHARGAAIGDCLSRILKKAGYDVTREYYVNDAGSQVDNLGLSLKARYFQELGDNSLDVPENGYHGEDVINFAKILVEEGKDSYKNENLEFFKKRGVELALENIKKDLREFRVEFDVFTSEKAIRNQGKVEKVLEELKPYCYQEDGALFLKTTQDGDDKDRVIIKKDGSYTYLLPDIAYHKDKFDRGYQRLIDLFGADHHGYIARIKSSMKSLGENPDKLDIELVQMVRLFKDGKEYKMSKRTGNAISMKELCEEVGVDGVRFFFVSRASSQHLDFDIDLAKTMGTSNPVYYCQYANARLYTMLEIGQAQYGLNSQGNLLVEKSELDLIKKLSEFSEIINESALTLAPSKITIYVRELAAKINDFYTNCRVLDSTNVELSSQRLALCKASQIVLEEGLSLIGVSAPQHM